MSRTFQALAFGLAIFAVAPAALAETADRPTMTLTGTGEVSVAPDMATVTSGVVTEAKTAAEALDANTKAMTEVIAAMKAAGIEAKDLQTSDFSVEPRYVYPQSKDGESQPPYIAGYTVSNQVAVKVRDLAKVGAVLDKAVSLGSNQIRGINFGLAEDAAVMDEARTKAVADARHKAALYAEAAGVKLGPILKISESSSAPSPVPFARMAMKSMADVPVEGGTLAFTSDITITWAIGE